MCLVLDQEHFPPCILSSLSDLISQECREFRARSVEQLPPEKPATLTQGEETPGVHYTNEHAEPPIGGGLSVPQQSFRYTRDEGIVGYGWSGRGTCSFLPANTSLIDYSLFTL